MRRTVFSVAFAAGIFAAVAAASAQTTPATGGTPAVAAPVVAPAAAPVNDEDVVSCRFEKTTGSLFSKRICHTQREWHQMSVDSKNLMNDLDAHTHMTGGLGGDGH